MGRGTPSPRLFGRDEDVTLLEELLGGVREGPVALVIMGEPGIGKTALWNHVIERSLGTFRILRCRPGESEVKLPYAALGDLLDGLPEEPFEDLPIPQRAALEVALLRAPAGDRRIERRTVATAFLGILRWLASSGPVLLAIDDITALRCAPLEPASLARPLHGLDPVRSDPVCRPRERPAPCFQVWDLGGAGLGADDRPQSVRLTAHPLT